MNTVSLWRLFVFSILATLTALFDWPVYITSQELSEFWGVNLLLEAMVKKLAYTASLELVPLMEVPGVKQVNTDYLSSTR